MSRMDGWEGDDEPFANAWALYERATENAINGKKGQTLIKELEASLLALPEKKLIRSQFCKEGQVCALGALAVDREIKKGKTREQAVFELERDSEEWHDEEDNQGVEYATGTIGLRRTLAQTIIWENDERNWHNTPEERYTRVLAWVQSKIRR